jgi:hypothetical protein
MMASLRNRHHSCHSQPLVLLPLPLSLLRLSLLPLPLLGHRRSPESATK